MKHTPICGDPPTGCGHTIISSEHVLCYGGPRRGLDGRDTVGIVGGGSGRHVCLVGVVAGPMGRMNLIPADSSYQWVDQNQMGHQRLMLCVVWDGDKNVLCVL